MMLPDWEHIVMVFLAVVLLLPREMATIKKLRPMQKEIIWNLKEKL